MSSLSGWPAFRGVSMEVWSQWKPGLLSVFLVPKLTSVRYQIPRTEPSVHTSAAIPTNDTFGALAVGAGVINQPVYSGTYHSQGSQRVRVTPGEPLKALPVVP